jgi:hypothetical protein
MSKSVGPGASTATPSVHWIARGDDRIADVRRPPAICREKESCARVSPDAGELGGQIGGQPERSGTFRTAQGRSQVSDRPGSLRIRRATRSDTGLTRGFEPRHSPHAGRSWPGRPGPLSFPMSMLGARPQRGGRQPGGRDRSQRVARTDDSPPSRSPSVSRYACCTAPVGAYLRRGPLRRSAAGAVVQDEGRTALVAVVPLGRLTAALAELLARTSVGELQVTPWRSAVLPDLGDASAAADLAAAGLVLDRGSPWRRVTACAGRSGCAKSLADVRGDLSGRSPRAPSRRTAAGSTGSAARVGADARRRRRGRRGDGDRLPIGRAVTSAKRCGGSRR